MLMKESVNCLYKVAVFLLPLFLFACEERFRMDLSGDAANGIAFNGIITNSTPPYFFQLTKPASFSMERYTYGGIEDAEIVITDVTAGIEDTLQYLPPDFSQGGIVYSFYNYAAKKNDRTSINSMYENQCRGVYVTTKIYGIEGHTYALDINYNGVHHTAQETMVPKTLITDLKGIEVDLGEKGKRWAPCISFLNRQDEENYYLFFTEHYSTNVIPLSNLNSLFLGGDTWRYSILSDEHLPENVIDYIIDDGEDTFGRPPGSNYPSGSDSLFVCLQSISKPCYDIFDQMIKQIRYDGGTYSPTPTSIPGNISGNVWGCFRVSAATEKGLSVGRQ